MACLLDHALPSKHAEILSQDETVSLDYSMSSTHDLVSLAVWTEKLFIHIKYPSRDQYISSFACTLSKCCLIVLD